MSAIFISKTEPQEKHKFLIFLKNRYFVMLGSIDRNIGVFSYTPVGFSRSVVLLLFPKYSQSYADLNVKSRPKLKKIDKLNKLL